MNSDLKKQSVKGAVRRIHLRGHYPSDAALLYELGQTKKQLNTWERQWRREAFIELGIPMPRLMRLTHELDIQQEKDFQEACALQEKQLIDWALQKASHHPN